MAVVGSHYSGLEFFCLNRLSIFLAGLLVKCLCLMKFLQASASKEKKADENYWVVGLNASKVFCVVCKSPELFPQVC